MAHSGDCGGAVMVTLYGRVLVVMYRIIDLIDDFIDSLSRVFCSHGWTEPTAHHNNNTGELWSETHYSRHCEKCGKVEWS